jgi:hypothetical protein
VRNVARWLSRRPSQLADRQPDLSIFLLQLAIIVVR